MKRLVDETKFNGFVLKFNPAHNVNCDFSSTQQKPDTLTANLLLVIPVMMLPVILDCTFRRRRYKCTFVDPNKCNDDDNDNDNENNNYMTYGTRKFNVAFTRTAHE